MLTKPTLRELVPGAPGQAQRDAFQVCSPPPPGPGGGSDGGGSDGGGTRTRCEQQCTLVGYESGSIGMGGIKGQPIYYCHQVCFTESY